MKHYRKALEISESWMTTKVRYNALTRVWSQVQDEEFKDLIEARLFTMERFLKAPRGYREPWKTCYRNASRESLTSLKLYCENAISKGKPEWQVMAERNGWTRIPPPQLK